MPPNQPETGQPWQPQPYPPMPYQPLPVGPRRPGTTTAAAVLGFVQSGLAIIGGIIGISAYSATDAADLADDADLVLVVSLLQFALCGVLVHAAVRLLGGRALPVFQGSLAGMLALCVFYTCIYVERLGEVPDDLPYYAEKKVQDTFSGVMVFPVLFAASAITAMCLAGGRTSKAFLR